MCVVKSDRTLPNPAHRPIHDVFPPNMQRTRTMLLSPWPFLHALLNNSHRNPKVTSSSFPPCPFTRIPRSLSLLRTTDRKQCPGREWFRLFGGIVASLSSLLYSEGAARLPIRVLKVAQVAGLKGWICKAISWHLYAVPPDRQLCQGPHVRAIRCHANRMLSYHAKIASRAGGLGLRRATFVLHGVSLPHAPYFSPDHRSTFGQPLTQVIAI